MAAETYGVRPPDDYDQLIHVERKSRALYDGQPLLRIEQVSEEEKPCLVARPWPPSNGDADVGRQAAPLACAGR